MLMYLPNVKGAVLGNHIVEIVGQATVVRDGSPTLIPIVQTTKCEVKKGDNTIDLPLKSTP